MHDPLDGDREKDRASGIHPVSDSIGLHDAVCIILLVFIALFAPLR